MFRKSRQFAALALLLIILLFSLAIGLQRISRLENLIATEVAYAIWSLNQVESEYLKFKVTVHRYRLGDPTVTLEAVNERFEIFWSRPPVVLESAEAAAIREVEGLVEVVREVQRALEEMEPLVINLDRNDTRAYGSILTSLDQLGPGLHQVVVNTHRLTPWHSTYRDTRTATTRVQIALAFVGILISGGMLILLLVRELRLTDRLLSATRRAELALRHSRARFSGILDIAADAIISVDENQSIRLFNQGAEAIFGYAAEEIIGQPLEVLLPERFRQAHRGHIEGFAREAAIKQLMHERRDIYGRRKDGSEFPAEASVTKLELDGDVFFTAMLCDVTDRKRAEEDLTRAKEEAELANRSKTEFLANMSHELRTPLNAIIGFAEMITRERPGPDGAAKYREFAELIHESGEHLLDSINDILDLSRIDAGKAVLYEEELELAQIVRSCEALIAERAENSGILLVVEPAQSQQPLLRADPRKLKQVLVNLLANALKFTPMGGSITIKAWCDPAQGHVLQVIDTGIGIAPEDIPKAMARFGQVQSELNRQHNGTGIGLPLAKTLAELHDGSLDLESEVGRGTTVTVRFPPDRVVPHRRSAGSAG